jgi:hypothetical protein
MREEVGAESIPNAPGWSRIVFIAAICALGGIGFLAATILMNGRALSFSQRSAAAPIIETPAPAPVLQAPTPALAKPKSLANDRFQAIDIPPRTETNKATLARCRSHVEAGRPFEALSLKRASEMREARKTGDHDPETICRDYLAAEARAGR